jgi:type I restriction enzyme M protein
MQEDLYSYQKGVGVPHVYAKDIENLKLPVPPIHIQEEIVNELNSYQAIIDGAQQVINNWKPTIKINPKWESVKLSNRDLFKIESGGTPSSKESKYWDSGNVNWATLVDLPANEYVSIVNNTERKITELGLSKSSAKILPKDSILISSRATIGRVAINKEECSTNQGFKNIIIKDFNRINVYFLANYIRSIKTNIEMLATGGTFKEVSKSSIERLEILLPPIEEQNFIVEKIKAEESIIESNKNLINIYQEKIKEKINSVWGIEEDDIK